MKVFISSNTEKSDISESGVMSQISWENPDMIAAMNFLFNTRPHEEIEAIIINKEGIKAKFKGVIL